jgi:hypothetical protein
MKVTVTVPVTVDIDFDTDGYSTVHIPDDKVKSAVESQLNKALEEMINWDDDNLSDALSDTTGWCVNGWSVTVG